jgi:drug/metabolite transporter (DMT)-like permease
MYICFIPLAMDLFASTLSLTALNYLSGSVFSITSSIVIVSSAVFTKILIKSSFKNNQLIGCLFAVAGVILTGLA